MQLRRLAILTGFVVGLVPLTGAAQEAPVLRSAVVPPTTYGTTHTSYQRIGMSEFVPRDSSITYNDRLDINLLSRYPTSGQGKFLATPHLPSGALVTDVEFDWCDTNAAANLDFLVMKADYTGAITAFPGSVSSSGSGGCSYSVATLTPPFQINNNFDQLVLYAFVPATDGTMSISGAIIRYQLQVSPAPATATFPDVPTGDFGFQYVEALVASGVTGGCGGGNYCPDSPVTRRQMAIFLAKALGLQFP